LLPAHSKSLAQLEINMSGTIIIVGAGPGVSMAVAERFGAERFSVALVARNRQRLDSGIEALRRKGITASAFPADAADPASLRSAIENVRVQLGSISVLHWNAYGGGEAGDLAVTDLSIVRGVFDVAIVGLLAAIQESLPDLRSSKNGAVLVTNGAYGEMTPQMDSYVVSHKTMGIALANAAKSKLVGLLAERLKSEGVYVGEVTIAATIKGSAYDHGDATLVPAVVADRFWEIYQARDQIRARVS
jgi:short-subunit dehydrogenase